MSTDAMIEDVVLEEIFYRETPKCESNHTWRMNPPQNCTHEVTHRMVTCRRAYNVCSATATAFLIMQHSPQYYCEHCLRPFTNHGIEPV